jgi:hypothetical protein
MQYSAVASPIVYPQLPKNIVCTQSLINESNNYSVRFNKAFIRSPDTSGYCTSG